MNYWDQRARDRANVKPEPEPPRWQKRLIVAVFIYAIIAAGNGWDYWIPGL